jgi:uncharacterized Zn finger protein
VGSELEKSLTHDVLLDLAGERYFERGEGYHRDGHVYSLVEHDRVIVAKVVGTEEYRVRLWTEDGLAYSCDCPLGVDGAFCKHCVAVGLAWLEGDFSEDTPGGAATMDDVRVYLDGREKDELVGIVMEHAAAFRRAIDRVVEPPGDYWGHGSPWNYARKLESMVESLAELLKEGFAAETIELSEYALAEVEEKAMDYDADGSVHGVLEALEDVHYAACLEARPDPEALARRLFEWEMGGHHDTLFDAANTYADVLGEEGLAEYRRLAGEEWARLPTLGPERGASWNYDRRRTRLTGMMRALAGDIEELVAVESRDLSHPQAYLRVVGIYHEAGDADKALEWAEEGMWVFPDQKSSGLRDFVIEGYHERSRHAEAMTLAWERYAERPRLEEYQRLKSHADRAGGWKTWREKALASVREDIARRNEEAGSSYFARPVDHSTLVEVLLWEGEVEAAWREAKEGGCSEGLWIELADRRARDHQEDSLSIYEARIEPLVEQTNNAAYEQAYELLLKTRALMQGLGREQEFEEYVKLLREEYKRKRNFMKLLSGME